jgi:hypothetical protein
MHINNANTETYQEVNTSMIIVIVDSTLSSVAGHETGDI